MSIYPILLLQAGYDTRSIFKWSKAGQRFLSSGLVNLLKQKKPFNALLYISISGERTVGLYLPQGH